jgi:hypothetical protein
MGTEQNIIPLLVSRKRAAALLGNISVATIIRMEARGILTPVRLNPSSASGQVFYRFTELTDLVDAGRTGAYE